MASQIIRNDNQFRVEGQEISLNWLADTRANQLAIVVFLRLLSGSDNQPLFTHQELAQIVGSSNRQASSLHVECFVDETLWRLFATSAKLMIQWYKRS